MERPVKARSSARKSPGAGHRFLLDIAPAPAAARPVVPKIRRVLRATHQQLGAGLTHLSLAIVGDAVMSDLHERFLQISGPTDVLSFELEHDEAGRVVDGEVIICLPQARRQARQNRSTLERELILYALHGLLHLCGMDDRTAKGFREMHRLEDQILTELGIGSIFSTAREAIARRDR